MTNFSSLESSDVYKVFHAHAGHPDITKTYENFTNRSGKLSNIKDNTHVVNIGWQYFIKKHLLDRWNTTFFNINKEDAIARYKMVTTSILGYEVGTSHLEKLHDLGYLPLCIKSFPEGTLIPYGVASATFETTVDGFEWLVGMLETVISQEVWPIQTSATTSLAYQKKQKEFFELTEGPIDLLPFMIHDFSARGMYGEESSGMSGFAHLAMGSKGSDTIAAGNFAEKYYNANWATDSIMHSVNATEHSVTCGWMKEGEYAYFKHLMENVAPTGILSVVSDTWDFWNTVTNIASELKEVIMNRDGKLVFRPDSGDPVDILCGCPRWLNEDGNWTDQWGLGGSWEKYSNWFSEGTRKYKTQEEYNGLIEVLWDTFGGTITNKGFKMLDEHIGAIYGDAITLERQQQIGDRLMAKGFVPQVVLGVGSYSFQYVTRDTHGSAMKATNVTKEVGDEYGNIMAIDQAIFKDPKTDSKKKSAKGLLRIERENGLLVQYDMQTREQEESGLLEVIFEDGVLLREQSLDDIREVVAKSL